MIRVKANKDSGKKKKEKPNNDEQKRIGEERKKAKGITLEHLSRLEKFRLSFMNPFFPGAFEKLTEEDIVNAQIKAGLIKDGDGYLL